MRQKLQSPAGPENPALSEADSQESAERLQFYYRISCGLEEYMQCAVNNQIRELTTPGSLR
jgi:hypothetical protein